MPVPTGATTVTRPDINEALYEYALDQNYIGLKLFPEFETLKDAGGFPVIPTEALLKLPNDLRRPPRAHYGRGHWEFERDTFECVEFGWEELVDQVEARMYAHYFDAEVVSGEICADTVLRAQEKRILDQCQNTAVFTATFAVANEWNDTANATPIVDVKRGVRTIYEATGVKPDTLVIGFRTFQALGSCAEIVDRIKYMHGVVERGNLTLAMFANAFEVRQVLVADVPYDSAAEGQAASIAQLWDVEYAFLGKVTQKPQNLKDPCIGRTFRWVADSPSNPMFESYWEDQTRADVIRARHFVDEEVVMAACGLILTNITDLAIAAP